MAQQSPALSKDKLKPNLEFMRNRDKEPVRGKFIFHEVPGGQMSFVYKAYENDDVERFDLVDGEIYTLPLGVAKHLNKNCWYPVHTHTVYENGKPIQKIGQKVRRCSFQSLEFVDIDDLSPVGGSGIVTVENL